MLVEAAEKNLYQITDTIQNNILKSILILQISNFEILTEYNFQITTGGLKYIKYAFNRTHY